MGLYQSFEFCLPHEGCPFPPLSHHGDSGQVSSYWTHEAKRTSLPLWTNRGGGGYFSLGTMGQPEVIGKTKAVLPNTINARVKGEPGTQKACCHSRIHPG